MKNKSELTDEALNLLEKIISEATETIWQKYDNNLILNAEQVNEELRNEVFSLMLHYGCSEKVAINIMNSIVINFVFSDADTNKTIKQSSNIILGECNDSIN